MSALSRRRTATPKRRRHLDQSPHDNVRISILKTSDAIIYFINYGFAKAVKIAGNKHAN